MSIEDHYNTPFELYVMTEGQIDGLWQKGFVLDETPYKCAIFTPTTERTVRVGQEDYIVQKNLYCDSSNPLKDGDYVVVDGEEFTIGNIKNTNNLNHHYQVQLISRIT